MLILTLTNSIGYLERLPRDEAAFSAIFSLPIAVVTSKTKNNFQQVSPDFLLHGRKAFSFSLSRFSSIILYFSLKYTKKRPAKINFNRPIITYDLKNVHPWGVEPQSMEPESIILSIELWVRTFLGNRDKNTTILHSVLIIEEKKYKKEVILSIKEISFYQLKTRNKVHNDDISNASIAFLQKIIIFANVFKY